MGKSAPDITLVRESGSMQHKLFGRRMIKLRYDRIDESNVLEAAGKALAVHLQNAAEERYLWNYYRGIQPVLNREKPIRPEINNKIVTNVASEVVDFHVGYRVGEPIQYIGRRGDKHVSDSVIRLNDFMFAENKASQDQEIVEWQCVVGTSYRMALPSAEDDADSPFNLYTVDPWEGLVAYSTKLGKPPLMGATIFKVENGYEMTIYTDSMVYVIRGSYNDITSKRGLLVRSEPHLLGMIPIFEYPANRARIGSFELVIDLTDALSLLESNRLDGVEQKIQSFLKFINCTIDKDGMDKLRELGAIMIKSIQGLKADVDVVNADIDQQQTQTLKNDLYQMILTICGVPNRNGGTSTSDTGAAVIFRDGWEAAESRAKLFENIFKLSERKMLKLVLRICRELDGLDLKLRDLDMKFTRRNYENIQSKSQVLTGMLASPRIHPKLAFEHCGMFSDPDSAYEMSEQYYQEQLREWEPTEVDEGEANTGRPVQTV